MSVSREELRDKVTAAIDRAPERGFVEAVDLAINLQNVDLADPANRVDEDIVLPAGTGKEIKVCVIAEGELAAKAKEADADLIFGEDRLDDLGDDKNEGRRIAKEHDFFLGEAPLMPKIGRIMGPILGPRGKMPDPVQPTDDIGETIRRLRGTVNLRSKESKTFHVSIGSEEMDPSDLAQNVNSVIRSLLNNLEKRMHNIDSIYVKTTMGPSVRVV